VRAWFQESFERPTPPQAQGWPAIQRGEHTLILAPTGSGKTLAAFLWGIDQLFRELVRSDDFSRPEEATEVATTNSVDGVRLGRPEEATEVATTNPVDGMRLGRPEEATEVATTNPADGVRLSRPKKATEVATTNPVDGVRLVYISPLKALNNDIHRNLRLPLAGIRRKANELGLDFPPIRVAVRSGDTPQRERQAMLRQPPHILITTPESFYLLLTSPKARDMFRTVRTVIVDEIHTLAGNKRGVHLSLSLERLQHLAAQPIQRLGLSATIQPLDEVARFLGGSAWQGEGEARTLQPRPVTIVNAAYKKALDLQVVTVVDDFRSLPGDSIWPSIVPCVLQLIRQHRTTLVFTNNRRPPQRTDRRRSRRQALRPDRRRCRQRHRHNGRRQRRARQPYSRSPWQHF
jgi:ATP-dependent Lhr-like helicase